MSYQHRPFREESRATQARVAVVWIAAVIAAAMVGCFAGPERQLTWVPIAMLLMLFLAAVLQLLERRTEGFIHRFALSLFGAALVLAASSLVFVLLGAHAGVLTVSAAH